MDIGDWYDVEKLITAFGEERFKEVLQSAQIGQFSPKSWQFWHIKLNLELRDMPVRRFE